MYYASPDTGSFASCFAEAGVLAFDGNETLGVPCSPSSERVPHFYRNGRTPMKESLYE